MALRKRGNSYQIDYIDPTGKRVRRLSRRRKKQGPSSGSGSLWSWRTRRDTLRYPKFQLSLLMNLSKNTRRISKIKDATEPLRNSQSKCWKGISPAACSVVSITMISRLTGTNSLIHPQRTKGSENLLQWIGPWPVSDTFWPRPSSRICWTGILLRGAGVSSWKRTTSAWK